MKTQKLKILICESDRRVLIRLESWIKAMSEKAFICDNGIAALDIFTHESPDIILVSQNLKNMGGVELIQNIKQQNESQAIIFMFSDEDGAHYIKQAIDLQVDKYLNKPIDASLLFKAVADLSQEKFLQSEYKAQKRILQDYKDALDISYSVTKHDVTGTIFYVNKLFCTTTNLSYDDAMKGIINPLDNPNEDMSQVFNILEKEYIYRDRQVFVFEDKQDHILDITAVAIVDEKENISEYLVFSNDVSEVVHAARKIKNQEEEKKLQKLNHVKELNRVKDTFLTVFTHELRTPLNAIINFSQYVKKHLAKEEFKKRDVLIDQVTEINKSGWHMLEMISNLIEAIKLRDSKIELTKSSFSLKYKVENVLKKYEQNLYAKDVTITCHKDFNIYTDETRITQVLENVISNATKYAHKRIEIILKSNDLEFMVEVLDDGDGFSDTQKVFNLFEQLDDDSMTRTASGTGVGLYIVKQLCDRMGYKIKILKSNKLGGARVAIKGKRDIE